MKQWAIVILIVVWQIIVYALIVGGVFVHIHELLGIPWDEVGFRNVVGTLIGWLLLELPLAAVVCLLLFWPKRRKRTAVCPDCGYDLRGHHESGCPECGWNREEPPSSPLSAQTERMDADERE